MNFLGDDSLSDEQQKQVIDQLSQFYSNPSKDVIIADVDEILVNITPKWVYRIYQNKDYFGKFMKLDKNYDPYDSIMKVLYRPKYYLNAWLQKPGVDPETEAYQDMVEKMIDLYDDDSFYDDLNPTLIGEALQSALVSGKLRKLYIVSKVTPNSQDSKTRFLKRTFTGNMDKVSIWYLDNADNKSDAVQNFNDLDKVTAYFEDLNSNVADVLQNTALNTVKIYSPNFTYNIPSKKYYDLIAKNNSELIRYQYVENLMH